MDIKVTLDMIKKVNKEVESYDSREWHAISKLLGKEYPHTIVDRIKMLIEIKTLIANARGLKCVNIG